MPPLYVHDFRHQMGFCLFYWHATSPRVRGLVEPYFIAYFAIGYLQGIVIYVVSNETWLTIPKGSSIGL